MDGQEETCICNLRLPACYQEQNLGDSSLFARLQHSFAAAVVLCPYARALPGWRNRRFPIAARSAQSGLKMCCAQPSAWVLAKSILDTATCVQFLHAWCNLQETSQGEASPWSQEALSCLSTVSTDILSASAAPCVQEGRLAEGTRPWSSSEWSLHSQPFPGWRGKYVGSG